MDERLTQAPGSGGKTAGSYTYTRPPRRLYETDRKDRLALVLSWGVGILLWAVILGPGLPGLGVTAWVGAWYALCFWYRGTAGLERRGSLFLFGTVVFLALSFSLWSNRWLRCWNGVFLCAVMTVQLFEGAKAPWHSPRMLLQRLELLGRGLFGNLGACAAAGRSFRGGDSKRLGGILAGLALVFPVAAAAVWLLLGADALFAALAVRAVDALYDLVGSAAVRAVLGVLSVPFLFGLLYALRRPGERGQETPLPGLRVDPVVALVMLLVMDLLYGAFLAVRSAALFGGAAYVERFTDLTYAEYARSGFFQLVAVAAVNLALVLGAVQLFRREGRLWRWVQVLATAMVAMSGLLLLSAAGRMTLYVSLYGLSFKRFLTYWGMVMLAVFFAAALMKLWRREFPFFRTALIGAAAGWLVLNLLNVDYLVARYNVALYRRQESAVMDLDYLIGDLSYDALWAVAELPEETQLRSRWGVTTLGDAIERRRAEAAAEAEHWQTWSVSAALAGRGGRKS